jgi:hypothetical protein
MQQRDKGAEEGEEKKPKCCLGALYFSEARYGAQKPPVSSPGARAQQAQLQRGGRARQRLGSSRRRCRRRRRHSVLPVNRLTACARLHLPALAPTLSQVCTGFAKRLKPTDDAAQLPTDSVPGGDFKCGPRCSCSSSSLLLPACLPPANQQLNDWHGSLTGASSAPACLPSGPCPAPCRYFCIGYSAWDEEALKRAAARRSSPEDAVQLPYCEGLEVVSAAAVNHRPELMGAGGPGLGGGGGGSGAEAAAGEQAGAGPAGAAPGGADVRQRPGRTFVPGAGRLPDVGREGIDWTRFKERCAQPPPHPACCPAPAPAPAGARRTA